MENLTIATRWRAHIVQRSLMRSFGVTPLFVRIVYVKKQRVEAGGELTNLQAFQSFRRLVSPDESSHNR